MRITLKINLLTTAWMLLILILINVVVFILFMNTTFKMEEDVGFQKAREIVKSIYANDTPSRIQSELKNYLTDNSYIRILEPEGQILYEVTNEKALAQKIKGKFVNTPEIERRGIKLEGEEKQVLIVRVPLDDMGFHNASNSCQ